MRFNMTMISFLLAMSLSSCGCTENTAQGSKTAFHAEKAQEKDYSAGMNLGEFTVPIDGIAEIERSGVYYPGLATTESGLREKAGDYRGAVINSYKELSYRYAYGQLTKKDMEEALSNLIAVFDNPEFFPSKTEKETALSAVYGIKAFNDEKWNEAASHLDKVLNSNEEPDSFLNWMLLVCKMESRSNTAELKNTRSFYSAVRARFNAFPGYWYRGARSHMASVVLTDNGISPGENISAIFAEQCINLSPDGPFSDECRSIIAEGLGLHGMGSAIKSKTEIDNAVKRSFNPENPDALNELMPLITLPDNSYTNYAVTVLKSTVSSPSHKKYFESKASSANGRLAERLRYISRG